MPTEEDLDPFDGPELEEEPIPERPLPDRARVRIEIHFPRMVDAARALRAYSLNLAVGGLCLRTHKEYELGTPLLLALSVERMDFKLAGSVAWLRGGVIGVRFDDLPEEERVRLTQVVDTLKDPP